MRQMPNFRKNALLRPQIGQRLYPRLLNLGFRCALTINDVFAKVSPSYFLKGIPNRRRRESASAFDLALVTIEMFSPLTLSILS